jgi:insertion element IS1 protein InsB
LIAQFTPPNGCLRQPIPCKIIACCTDEEESYKEFIPETHHRVSKRVAQEIERQNLDFRIHRGRLYRKTISFSKSEAMYDAVRRIYIHHSNVKPRL